MKPKDIYFYLSAFVAVLVFITAGYILLNSDFGQYKYDVKRNNVDFVSNTDDPAAVLDKVRASDVVLLSPEFVRQGAENSYSTSASTILTTVLVAKGKKVTLLARVVDSEGVLVACSSNFGDPKKNESVSIVDCKRMAGDTSVPRIFVSLPPKKDSGSKPLVVLEGSTATVRPHTLDAMPYLSFALAEALYPDAKQIINSVNIVLDKLK